MNSHKNKKPFWKKFGWWISAKLLKAFFFFIRFCPESFLLKIGTGVGILMYYVLPHRKKTGLNNLRMVFGGNISSKKRKALIKKTFINISQDVLEVVRSYVSPHFHHFLTKNISVQGEKHLDSALKKGKGVIAVSAHIGNFPIISAKMASLGYPFFLIAKDPNNIYLIDVFKQWRGRLGIGFIPYKPRRLCASEAIKVLRKNNIVFLLSDQNPRKKYGVYVDFFGYHVPMYGGPVVLARRTGAAIVPMFIHRNDDHTETITILPEISLKKSKDHKQDMLDNLRTINSLCEGWIRKYPEQWWWIHRRFRRARKLPGQFEAPAS